MSRKRKRPDVKIQDNQGWFQDIQVSLATQLKQLEEDNVVLEDVVDAHELAGFCGDSLEMCDPLDSLDRPMFESVNRRDIDQVRGSSWRIKRDIDWIEKHTWFLDLIGGSTKSIQLFRRMTKSFSNDSHDILIYTPRWRFIVVQVGSSVLQYIIKNYLVRDVCNVVVSFLLLLS